MTSFIKYTLTSLEPVRVSDDSSSQMGQTATRRYIPGSTIRGLVVSTMAGNEDFEKYRRIVLSDKIRFMNAYPSVQADDKEHNLIPSPKGFYEDKVEKENRKEMVNILTHEDLPAAYKRAGLGMFSEFAGDTLLYYTPETTSDLKINIGSRSDEKQNVFRNEYLTAGQKFTGYIAYDSEAVPSVLPEKIRKILTDDIVIGNARSAGLGKCRARTDVFEGRFPYEGISANEDMADDCYMYLASDTVMRNEIGEYCGLDLQQLASDLGVDDLQIHKCATSVTNIRGYNRQYGGPVPSVTMYEKGSVFHLTFRGTITAEKAVETAVSGIGERRNEGFGQIRFLKDYEGILYKQKLSTDDSWHYVKSEHKEDRDVLKLAAANYYRQRIHEAAENYISAFDNRKIKSLSNSQVGNIYALAVANRFAPGSGEKAIITYLRHALDKENGLRVAKERASITTLADIIEEILNIRINGESGKKDNHLQNLLFTNYEEPPIGMKLPGRTIMGFPADELISSEEERIIRLEILANLIRFYFKEVK